VSLLIVALQEPFRSEGIHVDSGAMSQALASVSKGLPAYSC